VLLSIPRRGDMLERTLKIDQTFQIVVRSAEQARRGSTWRW
jgi:hypothetical protein